MRVGAFQLSEPIPELRNPHIFAGLSPWMDAGNVATLVLSRLKEHCKAQVLGELEKPGQFFDFTRYRPVVRTENDQRVVQIPNATVFYAPASGEHDFLFLNVLEPHNAAEEYIESLAQLLHSLGVRRHLRIGAWYDAVPHTRPLPMSYSLRGQQVDLQTGRQTRGQARYQGPTSIMNLLTDYLERFDIENASLTVRLPYYAQIQEDFTGVARLLTGLSRVYPLLPSNLKKTIEQDAAQGEEIYRTLSATVSTDRSVQRAIQQMEAQYDAAEGDTTPPQEPLSLSPEIERFLKELNDRP